MIPGVDSWAVAVALSLDSVWSPWPWSLSRWILFGVRGFCLAVALDDLRGLALGLLSMIKGMGFALALAWSLCGRSLMICGALLSMIQA